MSFFTAKARRFKNLTMKDKYTQDCHPTACPGDLLIGFQDIAKRITRISRAMTEFSLVSRLSILASLLFLSACGFTPLYGQNQNTVVTMQFDQIYIANIPNQEGQYLRNALIDRLYQKGRPIAPRYVLSLSDVKERHTDLDITKSSDATRAQLRLDTTLTLSDKESGTVLLERDLMAITSYNKLQSHFTTRVSENATRESALNELARQVELQLALYFR